MVGPSNPRWARDGRVVVGQQFGYWTALSDVPQQMAGALYVRARCLCGCEKDVNLRMLEVGRTTRCKGCATRARHAREGKLVICSAVDRRLQKRVNAMIQRCTNPNDRSWRNYGERGIEYRLGSVREAVEYIKNVLPHPTYLNLDIDREDNDGHYERGNLRLVSRKQNLANRRRSPAMTS